MVCIYTVPLCAVCAALGGAHVEGGRSYSLASEITVTPEDQWGGCSNQATLTPACYFCFWLYRILVTNTNFVGLLILLTWSKYLKFCTLLKNVIYFINFFLYFDCMHESKVTLFNIEEWANGPRVSQISKSICFIIELYPGAYNVFLCDVFKAYRLKSNLTAVILRVALPGIGCSHIIKQAFFLCWTFPMQTLAAGLNLFLL